MRLPRFRIRTLLVVVAVASIPVGLWARAERFQELHRYHRARSEALAADATLTNNGHEVAKLQWYHHPIRDQLTGRYGPYREFTGHEYALLHWHMRLAWKYEQAARCP